MESYNTTTQLPKNVKRFATLDLYVNGEWQKTINAGYLTARQMVKTATKIAKGVQADHVQVFAAFGSLHLAEVICFMGDVELMIPACAVRCLERDIEEERAACLAPVDVVPAVDDSAGLNNVKKAAPVDDRELSSAGYCLDVYLNNDTDIYNRYTVPAIHAVKAAIRANISDEYVTNNAEIEAVPAVLAAAGLVRKYDKLKPTRGDLYAAKANYVAYIIESAQYEINNTINA